MLESLLNRKLTLHCEDDWESVFTFKRLDDVIVVTAQGGAEEFAVNLPHQQLAERLLDGNLFTATSVTGVPVASWVSKDFFHLHVGGVAGKWHLDGERCTKVWKLIVDPFDK